MIRHATTADLPGILEIYEIARDYMKAAGNPTQWGDHHPPCDMLEADIEQRQLYVCEEGGALLGVFALTAGDEPSYAYIENGAWLSDTPYLTIHRIASSGKVKGVFGRCVDYCKAQSDHLRIDTHADNKTMQRVVPQHGFTKCGIVYVSDGSARIAYEYIA